jgi:hypothetical protein
MDWVDSYLCHLKILADDSSLTWIVQLCHCQVIDKYQFFWDIKHALDICYGPKALKKSLFCFLLFQTVTLFLSSNQHNVCLTQMVSCQQTICNFWSALGCHFNTCSQEPPTFWFLKMQLVSQGLSTLEGDWATAFVYIFFIKLYLIVGGHAGV